MMNVKYTSRTFNRFVIRLIAMLIVGPLLTLNLSAQAWQLSDGPYTGTTRLCYSDPEGDMILVSMDSRTYRSTNGGIRWKEVKGDSERSIIISHLFRKDGIFWAFGAYSSWTGTGVLKAFRSGDNAETWTDLGLEPGRTGLESFVSGAIDSPFVVIHGSGLRDDLTYTSTNNGREFVPSTTGPFSNASFIFSLGDSIIVLGNGTFATTDRGNSWDTLSVKAVQATRFVGRFGDDILVYGTTQSAFGAGALYRLRADTGFWEEVPLPHSTTVTGLTVRGECMYVTATLTGSYRSCDGGYSWSPIPFRTFPPHDYVLELPDSQLVFGAADLRALRTRGLLRTFGATDHWARKWRQVGGRTAGVEDVHQLSDGTILAQSGTLTARLPGEPGWIDMQARVPGQFYADDSTVILGHRPDHHMHLLSNHWEEYPGIRYSGSSDSTSRIIPHAGELYRVSGSYGGFRPRHLWRSTDRGASWIRAREDGMFSIMSRGVGSYDSILFARGFFRTDTNSREPLPDSLLGLYYSPDRGVTWKPLAPDLPPCSPIGKYPCDVQVNDGILMTRLDDTTWFRLDVFGADHGLLTESDTSVFPRLFRQEPRDYYIHRGYEYVLVMPEYSFYVNDQSGVYRRRIGSEGDAWVQMRDGIEPGTFLRGYFESHEERLYLVSDKGLYYLDPESLYRLTVQSGVGSGLYRAGDTVHIFARELSSTEIFSGWNAPLEKEHLDHLQRTDEWHTIIVMPPDDVYLEGTVSDVPETEIRHDTLDFEFFTVAVQSALSDAPRGLIVLFHDSSQIASDWFSSVDGAQFIRDALGKNFGVLALDAREFRQQDEVRDYWQSSPVSSANSHVLWCREVVDRFRRDRSEIRSLPVFTLGVGNGGEMAAAVAVVAGYDATALYSATGREIINDDRAVPVIFQLTRQGKDDSLRIVYAESHHQFLLSRNLRSEIYVNLIANLYTDRFARIPGVDSLLSLGLFNELLESEELDSRGFLKRSPAAIHAAAIAEPQRYPIFSSLSGQDLLYILHELEVTYSLPVFFSDRNYTTLGFFEGILSSDVREEMDALPSALDLQAR